MLPLTRLLMFCLIIIWILTLSLSSLTNRYTIQLIYHLVPPPTFASKSVIDNRLYLATDSLTGLLAASPFQSRTHLADVKLDDVAIYTAAEINHLVDVMRYVRLYRLGFLISTLVLIWYSFRFSFRQIIHIAYFASIALLAGITLTALTIWLSWSRFFLLFHQVLFPQGNWAFPSSSALIQLFPESFWQYFGILTILAMLMISGLISLIALTTKKLASREPL